MATFDPDQIPEGKNFWQQLWQIFLICIPSILVLIYYIYAPFNLVLYFALAFLGFGIPASIRTIGADEVGFTTFFKRINRKYDKNTGLLICCWYLFSLKKFATTHRQAQFPAEPENVWYGDPDQLPAGKSLAIWVNTASEQTAVYKNEDGKRASDFKGDKLHSRMRIAIDGTVRWNIQTVDDAINFFMNVKNEEFFVQNMRDLFERVMNSELSTRTPAMVIKHRSDIDNEFKAGLEELIEGLGANIIEAQMLDPKLPKAVKDELDAVVKAGITKQVTITNSEGAAKARENAAQAEKKWEELTGQGKAEAAYALIHRETDAFKERCAELNLPSDVVLALVTVKELMQKSGANTIIYGDNPVLGQLFSTIPALKNLLTNAKGVI